jgi:hypothetical protein
MKADISRMTFRPDRGYAGVLFQQGRVVLDADLNEAQAIHSDSLRKAIVDINGPAWGPADGIGFKVDSSAADFPISKGVYYVGGLACVCPDGVTYSKQPWWTLADGPPKPLPKNGLIYIEAALRHVTTIQDAELSDAALEGLDTSTRTQVVWRVVRKDFDDTTPPAELATLFGGIVSGQPYLNPGLAKDAATMFQDLMKVIDPTLKSPRGQLKASVAAPDDGDTGIDCDPDPAGGYRGTQNDLYRVEIHRGGKAEQSPQGATFKWARGNASVAFPITKAVYPSDSKDGAKGDAKFKVSLILAHLGRDRRSGLSPGQWVELLDDAIESGDKAPQLLKVKKVDAPTLAVDLEGHGKPPKEVDRPDVQSGHAYLRRWDFSHRGLPVDEDTGTILLKDERGNKQFELEDGILVTFDDSGGAIYRRGDYWLIPARAVGRSIDWPAGDDGSPASLPPVNPLPATAPLFVLSGAPAALGRDARVQVKPAGTLI